nr:hypothetical protein Itr_chr09CG15860 [Ipomoea trifida]
MGRIIMMERRLRLVNKGLLWLGGGRFLQLDSRGRRRLGGGKVLRLGGGLLAQLDVGRLMRLEVGNKIWLDIGGRKWLCRSKGLSRTRTICPSMRIVGVSTARVAVGLILLEVDFSQYDDVGVRFPLIPSCLPTPTTTAPPPNPNVSTEEQALHHSVPVVSPGGRFGRWC